MTIKLYCPYYNLKDLADFMSGKGLNYVFLYSTKMDLSNEVIVDLEKYDMIKAGNDYRMFKIVRKTN
jgi:hypothetical protein